MEGQKQNYERKPYQKPQVECVHLIVEEAVLSGCKMLGAITGPGNFGDCLDIGPCLVPGS